MRALSLSNTGIIYQEDKEMPQLTSCYNVLVKVFYAGICRTDVNIAKGQISARENVIIGHEFCGKIVGFINDENKMDGWFIDDVVSANPMKFGNMGDIMCGKDCDGAFAEYITVPSKALIRLTPYMLSPFGAYIEPVAAALAPLKYITGRDRICIFGKNRIAELLYQTARTMGHKDIERVTCLNALQKDYYDCIIETEPEFVDAYVDALKPRGLLILKSRSFTPTCFTSNNIAMKEICIQGARYGDFGLAHHILVASANGMQNTLDTNSLFGPVYKLSEFKTAFAEAERPQSKKVFFKICAE